MADVKLDDTIKDKLKDSFKVSENDIIEVVSFFNKTLKPVLKSHYLSHLVASIEEIINSNKKKEFLKRIKNTNKTGDKKNSTHVFLNEENARIFSIVLVPIPNSKRKALSLNKRGGVIIYYADYLGENERRFVIAHELGHIVNDYILNNQNDNIENRASLFAYIALLDKNNFYKNEAPEYITSNDVTLFRDLETILHIS